jgi:hypothetical protein
MLRNSKLNTIPVLEKEWRDNPQEVVDRRGSQELSEEGKISHLIRYSILKRARRRWVRIKVSFNKIQRQCKISRKNHRRIGIRRIIEFVS